MSEPAGGGRARSAQSAVPTGSVTASPGGAEAYPGRTGVAARVGASTGSVSASPGGAEAYPPQRDVSVPAAELDDLGHPLGRTDAPRRVVSLVPSLTESVALSAPGLLVGATDYCTHPADLDVARVGGSKYPDLDRVKALHPDLVLANAEENELSDVDNLRAAGIAVWVTGPTTLAAAFTSLRRMLAACGISPAPPWLDEARRAWSSAYDGSPPTRTAVVPIWRRPWMVLGAGTFAGDVLRRLGVANAYGTSEERYPRTTVEEMRATGADLVVLPDEPYAFTGTDGPEEFEGLDVALVSGRHLTWYGPSLREARDLLERQLAAAAPAGSLTR